MESLRSTTTVTLAVWKALFLREALTRLSKKRLGWLWLFLEPIGHVGLLMFVFSVIRGRSMPGMDFAVFLAIGVLGYGMFSGIALRSMDAISANAALFAYRQVKPVDTILVRTLLEGILQVLVAVLLLAGAAFVGLKVAMVDMMGIFVAASALWALGTGIGLMLSVTACLLPDVAKMLRVALAPLVILSGVFYAPFMVPPEFRALILFNPIMHGIELLRTSLIEGYPLMSGIQVGYLVTFAGGSVFFGLALHVRFAKRLIQQ